MSKIHPKIEVIKLNGNRYVNIDLLFNHPDVRKSFEPTSEHGVPYWVKRMNYSNAAMQEILRIAEKESWYEATTEQRYEEKLWDVLKEYLPAVNFVKIVTESDQTHPTCLLYTSPSPRDS